MIAVLLITALFVFISVYFYFRAEKLQQSIVSLKRDTAKAHKENQAFSKSMALIASKTEESTKNRLQLLIDRADSKDNADELALLQPLVNNYAILFKACLMKKGKLHSTTKQCFTALENNVYKEFLEKLIKKDSKIQRIWNSNDFNGFITLVEALLVKYEKDSQDNLAAQKDSTAA